MDADTTEWQGLQFFRDGEVEDFPTLSGSEILQRVIKDYKSVSRRAFQRRVWLWAYIKRLHFILAIAQTRAHVRDLQADLSATRDHERDIDADLEFAL